MRSQYKFRVPGGLGNQLFSYFCALYVAQSFNSKSVLDLRSVDTSHFRNGIALLSLDMPQEYISISNASRSSLIPSPLYERFKVKFASLTNSERIKTFEPGFDSKAYVDEYLDSLGNDFSKSRTINGYFADFAFYDSLPDTTRLLRLRKPTNHFMLLSKSFDNHRSVAVHHRLGDFLELGQSVGILSKKYYSDALDEVIPGNFEKIVVFSNDTEKSKFLFDTWGIKSPKFSWLGPQDLVDPAETMLLMSKANSIICSNSTFSFWAARLSDEGASKIQYPAQFRKDDFGSVHNVPERWIPVHSSWSEFRG
jgi:hypothetical protein